MIYVKPATALLDENFEKKTSSTEGETVIYVQVNPPLTYIPIDVMVYFSGTAKEDILYIYLPDELGEYNQPAWIDGRKVRIEE